MSDPSAVAILPDRSLRLPVPPREDRRLWLSPALFVALPDGSHAESLLFSAIELPVGSGPALEVRCPHPGGLPWMTLEFLFGEANTPAVREATTLGLRLRAKALPAMTVHAKCAFATAEGSSIIDIDPGIRLNHEFNLFERELPVAATRLAEAGEIWELRIFLTLPQAKYFAAVISHAELYWL